MRNILFLVAVLANEIGGLSHAQGLCSDPRGPPNSEACVDYRWKVCKCMGWKCYWSCPMGGCQEECKPQKEVESGGCSDPSDLEEDLRAELDSPASSCEFPCNCIASGNQIAHKTNVKTPEDCDSFCNLFPKYCKFWTLIGSKGICFALTNCNYPKCGHPFKYYVSGPKGCPTSISSDQHQIPVSNFTVTSLVPNRIADGNTKFQGTAPKGCAGPFNSLAFGGITTITIPTTCLPLIEVTATLNGGTICKSFIGLAKFPNNVFICASPNGSAQCYVTVDQTCK